MSYCRWSSLNWRCDLYCYESAGGYTIHVAGNRVVGDIPEEPRWELIKGGMSETDIDEWHEKYNAVHQFVLAAKREDITIQHSGKTFNEATLEAFRDRLIELRGLGYRFPDEVLEEVDADIRAPVSA